MAIDWEQLERDKLFRQDAGGPEGGWGMLAGAAPAQDNRAYGDANEPGQGMASGAPLNIGPVAGMSYQGKYGRTYQYDPANPFGTLQQWGIDPRNAGWLDVGKSNAPIYDLNTEAGRAALHQQQSAAGLGERLQGMGIFASDWTPRRQQGALDAATVKRYGDALGIDASGYDLANKDSYNSYLDRLEQEAGQYELLGGLSGGFGGTGDPREAYTSLYKNVNGVLTPVGTPTISSAPKKGSWLAEHGPAATAILGAAAVAAGPWIAGLAAGGAGAGAAAGGAGAGGGAGITGTAGASGMAAYGGGAGGMGYGGLSAGMGSMGAGYGAAGASTLGGYGSLGASYWGAGGLGGYSGLGSTGGGFWDTLGQKAKDQLVKKARNELVKRALGGGAQGSPRAQGGLSGGVQGGSGGGPSARLGYAQAQERDALRQSYAPIAAAARRKRLAEDLADEDEP